MRTINRRQFFMRTAMVGAALTVPWYFDGCSAFATSQSAGLQKFVQPLRGVGPGGIPVATPDAFPAPVTGVTHYSFAIGQYTDQFHSDVDATTLWGYNPVVPRGGGRQPQRHLGGIIVVQRGVPIQLTYTNTLPPKHMLPVDASANFLAVQHHQSEDDSTLSLLPFCWLSGKMEVLCVPISLFS